MTAMVLDSPGGNIEAAIAFGQDVIERYQLNTGVAAGGICASACSVLWASGVRRSIAPDSRVGVHQASFDGRSADFFINEDVNITSMIGYHSMRVSLYLRTRGEPEFVWAEAVGGVEPDQIHWLSRSEIAESDNCSAGVLISSLADALRPANAPAVASIGLL